MAHQNLSYKRFGVALCEVCGNTIPMGTITCGYCGSPQINSDKKRVPFTHRCVNLEQGKPVVEVAMQKLSREIQRARCEKVQIMTLIHGYGSSGKGGAICHECRKTLEYLRSIGEINEYIIGEKFTRKAGPVKALLRRFPQLESDGNLNRNNRGITIVILK